MNNDTFNAFAQLCARRATRRSTLRAATLGVVVAAAGVPRSVTAQTSDAGLLVQLLYENVNAFQYEQAYALLGTAWQSQQSLATFAAGYVNTAFVQCEVASTKSVGDGTVAVHVRLVSWHNDGEIVGYEGAYTVGSEGGTLRILTGDNDIVAPSIDTPPLCTVGQLTFEFAPWDAGAGNRTSAVVATNDSGATCVVGGSPRLELATAGNVVRSTSRAGSPPAAIPLAPGESAQAPLRFADWCEEIGDSATISVELPGSPNLATLEPGGAGIVYPPCLGADQPALLEISGWVAVAS